MVGLVNVVSANAPDSVGILARGHFSIAFFQSGVHVELAMRSLRKLGGSVRVCDGPHPPERGGV